MIFIATPTYNTVPLEYHNNIISLISQLNNKKIDYRYAVLSDCNLARSRAELTQAFLSSGADKMVFIDTDMIFTIDNFYKLISHNLPIVSGLYIKRNDNNIMTFKSENNQLTTDLNRLLKVKYAPTGFLAITRECVEKVIEKYPETKYKSLYFNNAYALYDNIIDEDESYLSTDFSFCKRARSCGFEIYIDTNIRLGHCGTKIFTPTI